MADELAVQGGLLYSDSVGAQDSLSVPEVLADVATKTYIKHKQSIGTTEEAINLGEVTSPGWAVFINRDTTNYIELRVATAGAKFAKLLPGEFCVLRLASGAQAPYAIANSAACMMEYLIAMT